MGIGSLDNLFIVRKCRICQQMSETISKYLRQNSTKIGGRFSSIMLIFSQLHTSDGQTKVLESFLRDRILKFLGINVCLTGICHNTSVKYQTQIYVSLQIIEVVYKAKKKSCTY